MADRAELILLQYMNSVAKHRRLEFQMAHQGRKKNRTTALLLSRFFGYLGVDCSCLGQSGLGPLKLFSAAGRALSLMGSVSSAEPEQTPARFIFIALVAIPMLASCRSGAERNADADLAAKQAAFDALRASPPDPVLVAPPVTSAKQVGGWARFALPEANSASREAYKRGVVLAQKFEPPLDRFKAAAMLEHARQDLAKGAEIPAFKIKASLDGASGTLVVAGGTETAIANPRSGGAMRAGVCSEAYLGTALVDLASGKAAATGLRAITCRSDGCSAVFDLRPTRPDGGGVYDGQACVGLVDLLHAVGME